MSTTPTRGPTHRGAVAGASAADADVPHVTRYYCWECRADTTVEPNESLELQCSSCGMTFVEASVVAVEDPLSPEKFGDTVTSASTTPVSSPHISPQAAPIPLAQSVDSTTTAESQFSHSLDSTLHQLIQVLMNTRSSLGERFMPESASEGAPGSLNQIGDYALGDMQEIIDMISMNDPLAPRVPAASADVIASLPRMRVTAEQCASDDLAPCAVCKDCLVEDGEEESVVLKLQCQHIFHEECASTWLKQSSTCPVCRFDVTSARDDSKSCKAVEAPRTPTAVEPAAVAVAGTPGGEVTDEALRR